MNKKVPFVKRVMDFVEDRGRADAREIAAELGVCLAYAREEIRKHRKSKHPIDPRSLRICAYQWPDASRGQREPVYDISDEPDLQPPEVKGDALAEQIDRSAQIEAEIAPTIDALRAYLGNPFALALAYAGAQ